jgi:hypothetical protein
LNAGGAILVQNARDGTRLCGKGFLLRF